MRNKNVWKTLLLGWFILVGFYTSVFGYIWANGAGGVYDDGSGDDGTTASLSTARSFMSIEAYVTRAAGYYLQAEADFRKFLALYESKDTGDTDLQTPLRRSVTNLYAAIGTFESMIRMAEYTPYDQVMLNRLRNFDYLGFLKSNGLNPMVFTQVVVFLKSGDITGMLKKIYEDLNGLTRQLETAANDLACQTLPTVDQVWKWSDTFTNITQLGSYASRVFGKVKAE